MSVFSWSAPRFNVGSVFFSSSFFLLISFEISFYGFGGGVVVVV